MQWLLSKTMHGFPQAVEVYLLSLQEYNAFYAQRHVAIGYLYQLLLDAWHNVWGMF